MVADPLKSLVTLDEFMSLPEDEGQETEVIRGVMYVRPSPFREHQWLMLELARLLGDQAVALGGDRRQVVADTDLIIESRRTYVSPDVMYFAPDVLARLLQTRRTFIRSHETPPLLVVEIISRGTVKRDVREKAVEYAKARIPHYWIFGPDQRHFRELVLNPETGKYDLVTDRVGGVVVPRLFADGELPLRLDLDALEP